MMGACRRSANCRRLWLPSSLHQDPNMSRLTFAWLALPLICSLAWCDEPVQRVQALEVLQVDEDGPIGIEIRGEPALPVPVKPGGEKPADKPEKPEEVIEPDRTPTEPVDPLFL